jgi:malate dehydrogenase (oxaloacetate-decarboxylating)
MTSLQALQDRFGRNVVFQMNVRLLDGGDKLGAVISATIGAGAHIGQVNLGKVFKDSMIYELRVFAESDEQMASARGAVEAIADIEVLDVLDLAMESHRGGSCEMRSRAEITSNTDLRIVYTPGVARVCKAIEADPAKAREFTGIANKVAIVTDGTAILGLGDIGPLAGMPVMEGKSAIFWEFAGISAEPILINTSDPK